MKSKLKIRERFLGRHNAVGLYYNDRIIEIDPRQKAKPYLNTLVHEILHDCLPHATENKISRMAGTITEKVWEANYRRLAD